MVAIAGFAAAFGAFRTGAAGLFSSGGDEIPDSEWKLLQEQKRIRVLLPGEPTRKVQQAGGGFEMIAHELAYSRNLEFIVGYSEGPIPLERRGMFEAVLNDSCDGAKREVSKKVDIIETRRESIQLGGFPGKRMMLDIPERNGQAILCVYFTGEHLYVLGVIGRGYGPDHQVVKHFFDSFEILETSTVPQKIVITPRVDRPSEPSKPNKEDVANTAPGKRTADVDRRVARIPGERPVTKAVGDGSGLMSTEIRGGTFDTEFRDVAKQGALLVGFEIGLGKFVKNDIVTAIRPIYRSGQNETFGQQWGKSVTKTVRAVAKPGYAVGAITVRSGLVVDGLSLTFMKVVNGQLDPGSSYESEWIGGMHGSGPSILGGDGAPTVGIIGKTNRNGNVSGIGLLQK